MNQMINDGNLRYRLASANNILCFELDAAGLPSYVPCLIIRGICDYADSHSSDTWQGVAAAAAAAYTTELLSVIKPISTPAVSLVTLASSNVSGKLHPNDEDFESLAVPLVKKLSCYPIAIVHAAGYMKSLGQNLHDYLAIFHEQSRLEENSLNALLDSMLENLRNHQPEAADFLFTLTSFNVEEIPQRLLQPSREEGDNPPIEVQRLVEIGLLSYSPDKESFFLHNAVGLAIRERLENTHQEAYFASKALELMADRVETCEALIPVALSTLRQKLRPSSWEAQALLLFKVGVFQHNKGEPDQAFGMLSEACKFLKVNHCPDDQPSAAMAREASASVLLARGGYMEATQIIQATLEQKLKKLGDGHPS
ncbi:uncharacterized protein PV06_06801 [Exophiala oligosperma]|uniref:MalT-like TPR region domain-containing protein n=1 Tax=Exophiala oligosperma TaxID=215243 RepID=A0A0D2AMP0_9EURO|nr:uncharacterized protein PV06_06801 [Exophiala oligosperma]KIW41226.1 hypothetical protein PV06_06801 [Exophiala oligosperma]